MLSNIFFTAKSLADTEKEALLHILKESVKEETEGEICAGDLHMHVEQKRKYPVAFPTLLKLLQDTLSVTVTTSK